MDNKTKVKPGGPSATPCAATSVESIAPEKQENQYASGGEHQEQKKELKKSVKKAIGRVNLPRARASTARVAIPERLGDKADG